MTRREVHALGLEWYASDEPGEWEGWRRGALSRSLMYLTPSCNGAMLGRFFSQTAGAILYGAQRDTLHLDLSNVQSFLAILPQKKKTVSTKREKGGGDENGESCSPFSW